MKKFKLIMNLIFLFITIVIAGVSIGKSFAWMDNSLKSTITINSGQSQYEVDVYYYTIGNSTWNEFTSGTELAMPDFSLKQNSNARVYFLIKFNCESSLNGYKTFISIDEGLDSKTVIDEDLMYNIKKCNYYGTDLKNSNLVPNSSEVLKQVKYDPINNALDNTELLQTGNNYYIFSVSYNYDLLYQKLLNEYAVQPIKDYSKVLQIKVSLFLDFIPIQS